MLVRDSRVDCACVSDGDGNRKVDPQLSVSLAAIPTFQNSVSLTYRNQIHVDVTHFIETWSQRVRERSVTLPTNLLSNCVIRSRILKFLRFEFDRWFDFTHDACLSYSIPDVER